MDEILRGDPQKLAKLLDGTAEVVKWSDDDLRSILLHQLAAPIVPDLGPAAFTCPLDARTVSAMSFGRLLSMPNPPVELLQLAKDFAKTADCPDGKSLPTEIATLLYYALIAISLVRSSGVPATNLTPAQLRAGMEWGLARSWLVPDIAELLAAGIKRVPDP
jgi:hypothetical protein